MRKKFSALLVFGLMLTAFIFPHKNVFAKETPQEDFYSKFTSIIREYDYSFEDITIEKDDLTQINDTYMISDEHFSNITGDRISHQDNIYSITNEEYNIKLNIDDNTFITEDKIIESEEEFIKSDDTLLIPIEDLAFNLGYELSPTDNGYRLSRTFASKRLIIDCDDEIDLLDSVAYASHNDLHIIQFNNEQSAKNAFDHYSSISNINGVAVDMRVEIAENEENTSNYNSWGGDYLGIENYLSKISTSSLEEVVVAVIDTGADHDHHLIKDRIIDGGVNLSGEEDLNQDYPYEDGHKHGTHVSGIIADLTPNNVKLLPIKALRSDGKGDISSIIAGIELCVDYKSDNEKPMNIVAINMSLGGTSPVGSQVYNDYSAWINNALNNDILSVVAAGNETQDCVNVCPANVQNAITVSALKKSDGKLIFDASYSNYGSYVDICAPGTDILSGVLNNELGYASGTSMATPHVSAMVALLMSNTNTNFNCEETQNSLFATAIDLGITGKDPLYGYGCVNIAQGYARIINNVTFSDTTLYHQSEFELTLSCDTPNSVIYYTLDGTTPSKTNGIIYNTPIIINQSCKVTAIAYTFADNVITGISPISSQSYSFDGITPEIYFKITNNGVITGYTGAFTLVGIPATINGIIPVAIDANVFAGSTLEEITLPNTIKTIGMMSFYNCTNLNRIIANGVLEIDRFAFYGNISLTSISFDNVEIIDAYAFYLCKSLENINLPNVKDIKMSAFNMPVNDAQLTTINIPNATNIASYAFFNIVNLTTITMPNIEKIGAYAFQNCNNLSSLSTPNLKHIGNETFSYSGISNIDMPIIQTIGIQAFYKCKNLENVILSKYIELIGDDAFEGCNIDLKFNIYEGNKCLFDYIEKHHHIFTIINSSTNLDYTLSDSEITITGYSYTDNEIVIPEYIDNYPVTTISNNVFKNSTKIKYLNSKTLRTIGDEAFYDCSNLQSIYIPNIENIGSKAFSNCTNLISADIVNVKTLKNECFINTPHLTKLTFNESITTIENYAIGYNYNTNYELNENFRIFYNYNTSKDIPQELSNYSNTNNIKIISYNEYAYSFYYQIVESNIYGTTAWITYFEDFAIGEVTIPKQVTNNGKKYNISTIDVGAFEDCSFLTKINLPSTIHTIENYAFANCIRLKSINLENVVNFGVGVFENCLSIEEADLQSTQEIPNYLFYNCKSLNNINIPIVNTIGISSFENCYFLKTINFNNQHLKTIHSRAFYNNHSLELCNLNGITTLGTQSTPIPTYYQGEVFVNCFAMDRIYLNNIVNMGNNLFTGSNIKKVFLGRKLENITNSITDTDGITIYGYPNTTAEYYANNYKENYSALNNIPLVQIQNLAIKTNLPNEKIRVQQNNELYLTFEAIGSDLTYYFYSTNSSHSESILIATNEKTVQIDTTNIGTFYYYFIVKNWDGQMRTSNYVTIEVLETSQSYVINIETDGNGSVSPNGELIIAVGERKYFTITPNTNFRIYKLTINGEDKTSIISDNTFSIYNLYSNATLNIYIEFEVDEFDITITSLGNGNSSDDDTYLRGEDISLSFIAHDHYHINSLVINGKICDEAHGLKEYSYIITSIDKNYNIKIEYSIDTYSLLITKSGHGELSASGNIVVEYGSYKTIEFFPNDGYKVNQVTLDNNIINYTQSYTFSNINTNHTLHVEFAERKYNIILNSDNSAGSVIMNGSSEELDYGESRILTITPKEGYLIDKVYINDESVNVIENEVIITHIDEDLKIDVKYKKDLNITISKPITDITSSPYAIYIIITIVGVVFLTIFLSLIFRRKRI